MAWLTLQSDGPACKEEGALLGDDLHEADAIACLWIPQQQNAEICTHHGNGVWLAH